MKFEYQFDENSPKITVELSAGADLSTILEQFECFLRGAGYVFEGELDFILTENTFSSQFKDAITDEEAQILIDKIAECHNETK